MHLFHYFQEVDGHLSVTDTQQYKDAVEAFSETELNKKLAEELDYLQELLEDEKKGEIHTDTKWVDPEAEIPWEQTHRRVLTMTVDTRELIRTCNLFYIYKLILCFMQPIWIKYRLCVEYSFK